MWDCIRPALFDPADPVVERRAGVPGCRVRPNGHQGTPLSLYLRLNHQSKSIRSIRMMGTPLWEGESDATCNNTMFGIKPVRYLQYPFPGGVSA